MDTAFRYSVKKELAGFKHTNSMHCSNNCSKPATYCFVCAHKSTINQIASQHLCSILCC